MRPPGGLVFRAARGGKKYEVRKLRMTLIWMRARRGQVGRELETNAACVGME